MTFEQQSLDRYIYHESDIKCIEEEESCIPCGVTNKRSLRYLIKMR